MIIKNTVMIIKNVARVALASGCLTAIVILPTADAQMGAPGGYGYAPPRQVRMAMAPRQALMGMVRRRALMSRRASMSRRRPRQARPGPS